MKKLMSLFLIVTLLGSVLVGCGTTEAGESISESSTVNADGGNQEEQFEFASSDTFDIDNQSEIGHLTLAGYRVFAEKDKKFGEGVVMETKGEYIVVDFETVGRKQLNLQLCLDKGLMEFIHNG